LAREKLHGDMVYYFQRSTQDMRSSVGQFFTATCAWEMVVGLGEEEKSDTLESVGRCMVRPAKAPIDKKENAAFPP